MKSKLYCRHCKKTYEVERDDLMFIQRFDPEHFVASASLYSYSGGCFFKNLAQLKRNQTTTRNT